MNKVNRMVLYVLLQELLELLPTPAITANPRHRCSLQFIGATHLASMVIFNYKKMWYWYRHLCNPQATYTVDKILLTIICLWLYGSSLFIHPCMLIGLLMLIFLQELKKPHRCDDFSLNPDLPFPPCS